MQPTDFSRRDFLRGLTAGTLSAALLPASYAARAVPKGKSNAVSLPPFFDCNKYVGPDFPGRADFPKVPDLLRHLDRLGIDRAVVWHTSARKDPLAGNEQLVAEIATARAKDRLIPSFVIAPSLAQDAAAVARLLKLADAHRVRAFHYLPGRDGLSVREIAPVLGQLLPARPVLFLDCLESLGRTAADVPGFVAEFPQVPVVFTNAMWSHYRRLFPLMDERPNVYVDASLLHTYRVFEDLIQRFGAGRILFGTGWKAQNGASIASLAHTEFTPAQFDSIAHGNLERLLEIEKPLSGWRPVTGNRLWHRLLRREHLGHEMLDAHGHMSPVLDWKGQGEKTLDLPTEHILRSMDGMGVRSQIVAEFMEFYSPDDLEHGTPVEKVLGRHGDRFRGYLSTRFVTLKNAPELLPLLDKVFSRSYYVGFKTHGDRWGIQMDDPRFNPIWEFAHARRLPILVHTWNTKWNAPVQLTEVVRRYPDASFLLAHAGNTDRRVAEKLARENPNVYLEWAGSFLNPDDWRETFDRVDHRQLIYGSDGISWDDKWGHSPAWELGRLFSIDLPDEKFGPMLGPNLRRILEKRKGRA